MDQVADTATQQATLEDALADLREKEDRADTRNFVLPPAEKTFPGMAITNYVLHDIRENGWQWKAEPYLFGIAVDSTLKPMEIPWGLGVKVDAATFSIPKAERGVRIDFGNRDGAPLVLPPVQDFLAIALMVADSDNAKASTAVLKAIGDVVSKPEIILVAAGINPTASAILAILGGLLNVTVAGIENNRDDIIAAFTAYYGPSKLVPGMRHTLERPGATATLRVMDE